MCCSLFFFDFFFFKQKTAYEMRISDWSSDVCSSDLLLWVTVMGLAGSAVALFERALRRDTHMATLGAQAAISLGFYAFLLFSSNPFARIDPPPPDGQGQIGRASCRERVCQYV